MQVAEKLLPLIGALIIFLLGRMAGTSPVPSAILLLAILVSAVVLEGVATKQGWTRRTRNAGRGLLSIAFVGLAVGYWLFKKVEPGIAITSQEPRQSVYFQCRGSESALSQCSLYVSGVSEGISEEAGKGVAGYLLSGYLRYAELGLCLNVQPVRFTEEGLWYSHLVTPAEIQLQRGDQFELQAVLTRDRVDAGALGRCGVGDIQGDLQIDLLGPPALASQLIAFPTIDVAALERGEE